MAQSEAFLRGHDPLGGVARARQALRIAESSTGPGAADLRDEIRLALARAENVAGEWHSEIVRRQALHTQNELRAAGVPIADEGRPAAIGLGDAEPARPQGRKLGWLQSA